jgi:hypothetical protein
VSEEKSTSVALWSPGVAAVLGLFFTPILGAWLHAKNWTELGEETKAKRSMFWVYGGALIVILFTINPKIGFGAGFWYFVAWFFVSARPQMKHVKEQLGGSYEKRGLGKPIGIAVACVFGWFVCLLAWFMVVEGGGDRPRTRTASVRPTSSVSSSSSARAISSGGGSVPISVLREFSGVWRARDTSMFMLRLASRTKVIKVAGGATIPVAVKSFDSENHILVLVSKVRSEGIFTFRKIFSGDGFQLLLTLPDGTQALLSYVRDL